MGQYIATEIYRTTQTLGYQPRGYVEPFVGMCGVFQYIPELLEEMDYIAGDINGSVVEMWRALQRGWKPPQEYSREKYLKLRETRRNTPDSAIKGYVGHQYSYGGIYFGAYRGDYVPKLDCSAARKRVQEIAQRLATTKFYVGDYRQFSKIKGYIMYLDPPYSKGANKYVVGFKFKEFLSWARKMAQYNLVFISNTENIPGAIEIYSRKMRYGTDKLFLL